MEKTFNIEVTMEERWVDDFCSFLKYLQRNGSLGHSSLVGFYADGDGDFRPRFRFDTEFNLTPGQKTTKTPELMFDAG